jgi:hypothetical protein
VGHHEARRELVLDGVAAEHGLRGDAERQRQGEPQARSRRNGRRRHAATAATTVMTPTRPLTIRLENSISACVLSGG